MRHATGRSMKAVGVAAGRVPRHCADGVRIEQRELVRQRVVGQHGGRDDQGVEDEPTPTSGPPVPATVTDGKATIDVTVGTDDFTTSGGTRVVSVPKGTAVTINMTAPDAEDYHLHGYDLEQKADGGKTSTFEFTADQTGQFDLESHLTEQTLLVLVVV